MFAKLLLPLALLFAGAYSQSWYHNEIGAWHFHTYFFETYPQQVNEITEFRQELRRKINDGTFAQCSLNRYFVGWDGPHPVSQFEMCCNSTSYATANSFFVQNHGNLSVFVHPLSEFDQEDHLARGSWMGQEVILYGQCPCLYPYLPKPRPCPVYPLYEDDAHQVLSRAVIEDDIIPIPGTEDYQGRNKNFNILTDKY